MSVPSPSPSAFAAPCCLTGALLSELRPASVWEVDQLRGERLRLDGRTPSGGSRRPLLLSNGVLCLQLCGGGPSLSLWHLRSLSPTSVFPLRGCQRQAAFHQDMVRLAPPTACSRGTPADPTTSVQILAIGEGPFVSHCLLGGDIKAEIPCTPKSLNSLQLNSNSTEHRVSGWRRGSAWSRDSGAAVVVCRC